ncbi:MAG: phosphate acyltransferase [bacterium]|nr:phosphate acyltransferase [bacterium]
MPPLRTSDDIVAKAQEFAKLTEPLLVAVPAAHDDDVIGAIQAATNAGFVRAILIGDEAKITHFCSELNVNLDHVEIIPSPDDASSAKLACQLAKDGKVKLIMKGNLPTGKLLKILLAKEYGLRRGRILSHVAVLSMPHFPRLLGITDGGMVVAPDEKTRPQLVVNAIEVFHALGIEIPKVALLAATDDVVPGVPITRELAAFAKACERGAMKHAIVDGPLAFDSAVWPAVTDKLPFASRVAGSADIVVVSAIEVANIVVKALDILADAVFAGVIMGAKIPVALVSRSDTARNKLTSLALATLVAASNSRRQS